MNRYIGSFIRHLLTLCGGAVFAQSHGSHIDAGVAIVMAAIGAGWSVAKARAEANEAKAEK